MLAQQASLQYQLKDPEIERKYYLPKLTVKGTVAIANTIVRPRG